jgi:uncharacterized cupin superfamily protein
MASTQDDGIALGSALNVRTAVLEREELDPSQIVSGNPEVSCLVLSSSLDGRIVRGIWKCTRGIVTDVEQDEMFTVIEGRATVAIEGGVILEISPGYVGMFRQGARTTWTIHEDVLKTFQITMPASSL